MTPKNDVLGLMDANLAAHLAHLPNHLDGAVVLDSADLLLIDSGVSSDTFNAVCRAHLDERNAGPRIEAAIRHFRSRERPFSWWVSPTSAPARLGDYLTNHGLRLAETEVAMSLDLRRLPLAAPLPDGLEIRAVSSPTDLMEYAAVIAANWDPPALTVIDVYSRAAPGTLAPGSPARYYTGYVNGEPVAASECFIAHGAAGIYNVVTLPPAQRRGIGTALTSAALNAARLAGCRAAVLQASGAGERIYSRLGFTPCGEIREYKPTIRELALP